MDKQNRMNSYNIYGVGGKRQFFFFILWIIIGLYYFPFMNLYTNAFFISPSILSFRRPNNNINNIGDVLTTMNSPLLDNTNQLFLQ